MSKLPNPRLPFNAECLQLRFYNFAENDRIAVLFSREYGLLRAIAKGARSSRSKMGPLLSPLRHSQIQLVAGKGLHKIRQVQGVQAWSALQKDYDKLMCGLVMAELIALFCQEEDAQPEVFDGTIMALALLAETPRPKLQLLWYLLFFLGQQGALADLDTCTRCDLELFPGDPVFFETRRAGLQCDACTPSAQEHPHLALSEAQHESLLTLRETPNPAKIQLTEAELNSLLRAFHTYVYHASGQRIKSFSALYADPESELALLTLNPLNAGPSSPTAP